jgi:hypothetical protein
MSQEWFAGHYLWPVLWGDFGPISLSLKFSGLFPLQEAENNVHVQFRESCQGSRSS